MLSTMLLICVIVWAVKELCEGTGIKDWITNGKKSKPSDEE